MLCEFDEPSTNSFALGGFTVRLVKALSSFYLVYLTHYNLSKMVQSNNISYSTVNTHLFLRRHFFLIRKIKSFILITVMFVYERFNILKAKKAEHI